MTLNFTIIMKKTMAAKYKLKENTEKCTIKNIKDWLSILNKKKYDLSCKWIKYIAVNVEVNKFQKKNFIHEVSYISSVYLLW